jgi:hypothetical protein
MLNVKLIKEKRLEVTKLNSHINGLLKKAKWLVVSGGYSDYSFNEKILDEVDSKCILSYENQWDYQIMKVHSDSLIAAIMYCYLELERPKWINNVKFEIYTFDFIPENYDKLMNCPDKDKIVALIETLDLNNIELAKQLINGL